jgi:hypothetical protein
MARREQRGLSTRRLLAVALLPINFGLLLVGEEEPFALFSGQLCPLHIRIREVALLEVRATKVCISEVCAYETVFSEYGSTEVTIR